MDNGVKALAKTLRRELATYRLLLKDRRTPWLAKACLCLAIGYLLLPFDLIPDFIPVLGQLDDLILVPGLIYLALRLTPPNVIADCRVRAQQSSDKK